MSTGWPRVFRYSYVLVFIASVLITALFGLLLPADLNANESSDYDLIYAPVARNILAGQGIRNDADQLATRYPPGFSLILAAVFGIADGLNLPEADVVNGFILICTGLTAGAIYGMARLIWQPWQALLAAFVWMTYPFGLWLTKQPNSEVPFMVVFYFSLWALLYTVRIRPNVRPWYLLIGMLVGVAMLIRPAGIALGVIYALAVWRGSQPTRLTAKVNAALILIGNLVVILPWLWLVYVETGNVIPLSTGGRNSIVDGLTFAVYERSWRGDIALPADVIALQRDILTSSGNLTSTGDVGSLVADKAREQPFTVLKLFAIKAARSWYGTDSTRYELWILLLQVPYIVLALPGMRRAYRQGGWLRSMALFFAVLVVYFWITSILVLSILRYMLPAMGLLMVFLGGYFAKERVIS